MEFSKGDTEMSIGQLTARGIMEASALYEAPFSSRHAGGPEDLFAGKENVIDAIFQRLKSLEPHSRTVTGCCPGHDDNNPSFEMRIGTHRFWVKCYAGCSQEEIATALGLPPAGDPKRQRSSKTDTSEKPTGDNAMATSLPSDVKKTPASVPAKPKPKKGTKNRRAPTVHKNATDAMFAVAYGLNQKDTDCGRMRFLVNQRPASHEFRYYLTCDRS
ncbi:MAG: hypothetical protein ABGZ53_28005 [Fuerstiella sp.]